VPAQSWDELEPLEKADVLRRDFDIFAATERSNVQARADRHGALEKRAGELEEALKQLSARLSQLEGKNDQPIADA
jgi:hypothetical protein